jgi:hypothetical protein
MRTISIHQPNYLPWLGYFYKIAQSDIFVFLDDCQYSKNSWQNRVRIYSTTSSFLYLSQPVKSSNSLSISTSAVNFASKTWKQKHRKTLHHTYCKFKHYDTVSILLDRIYSFGSDSMSEFNINAICLILDYLDINPQMQKSSDLGITTTSTQRLVDICAALNGTVYLHGLGGLTYHDNDMFLRSQITCSLCAVPYPLLPSPPESEHKFSIVHYLVSYSSAELKCLLLS